MRTHGMTSLVAAASHLVDRRWRYAVLAALLVACSDETAVPDPSDFVGLWQVVSVNGQNLPAFTNSGQTFFGGFLTLAPGGGTSAEEHCAGGDNRQVVFNRLAWLPSDQHDHHADLSATGRGHRWTLPCCTAAACIGMRGGRKISWG